MLFDQVLYSFKYINPESRPARGGGKIPGAWTGLGAQNLDKTSGHCTTVKRVGAP